jgi:hypothetical protein
MRQEILIDYKEFDNPEKVDYTTISTTFIPRMDSALFIKRPERGKAFHKKLRVK